MKRIPYPLFLASLALHTLLWTPEALPTAGRATLEIRTHENGEAAPSRIGIRNSTGDFVIPEGRYPYHHWFAISGEAVIEVTPGVYTLTVNRGLEYEAFETQLDLVEGVTTELDVPLVRWIDLNQQGFYSGDIHVHRPIAVIPKLMLASDLNLCTVQSLWNQQTYWKDDPVPEELVRAVDDRHVFHVLSEEDERNGGAVMFYNLKEPIPIAVPSRAYPSSLGFIEKAHEQGAWVEEEKPFWWEAPINVALGGVKSTEIVNNHFCENWILNNEAWGRPRDPEKYSAEPIGYCEYVLDLYYRFLNAGFPLIPTAGSATGVLPNPIGYNRMYVRCEDFSYDSWWKGLSEGRHFVTNGPALFVEMDGKPHWEPLPEDAERVRIHVKAMSLDGITRIEVIGDGKRLARYDPLGAPNEAIWEDDLSCSDLSWLAVRVFEKAEGTVQFAHTSPTPIEGRSSKWRGEAGAFFVEWIDELIGRVEGEPDSFDTPEQMQEIVGEYQRARRIYAEIADGE